MRGVRCSQRVSKFTTLLPKTDPFQNNSDSIHIKDCSGASIYLLDASSDVEVTGCRDCEVYVTRVVDGPVLLEDCVGCKLVVAAQQFQAKRCHDCRFGIYSVTGPTLSESSGIEISPWSGCNDDGGKMKTNQFMNVYDASDPSPLDKPRNFVVRFDPVVSSRVDHCEAEDNEVENGFATNTTQEDCSIKAIKMCEVAKWQKTLDLIDLNNNNSKHLTRFKSVLLSMTTTCEGDVMEVKMKGS